ncbi:MAG: hypothetical protein WKF73_08315, partial [Nocardioidaceae bacterium]
MTNPGPAALPAQAAVTTSGKATPTAPAPNTRQLRGTAMIKSTKAKSPASTKLCLTRNAMAARIPDPNANTTARRDVRLLYVASSVSAQLVITEGHGDGLAGQREAVELVAGADRGRHQSRSECSARTVDHSTGPPGGHDRGGAEKQSQEPQRDRVA